MRRWWPWVLAMGLAAGAGTAGAQSPADAVVQQLREQGYVEFDVSRTLLGRIRVVALSPEGEQREIVFSPATGEILRDYSEAADGSVAPRVLDRPEGRARPQGVPSPEGNGQADVPRPDDDGDGNRGHGNDEDGSDSGNPGRGRGNDGTPGNGNDPSRGGGNGNGKG